MLDKQRTRGGGRKRRAPGEGTLFKRYDGYWIGQVDLPTTDGKRRKKTVSSKDYRTALNKLRGLRKDIAAGMVPTTGSTTVAKWLDHWLNTIHGPTIRPLTFTTYDQTIRLYINPFIGGKRLDRLTPEDVRGMHRGAQKTSTRAAQKAHQVLRQALKDAVREGVLGRNVAAVVAPPRHVGKRREAFTADQSMHIIRTAIASCDETQATRWVAAFLTGARQGELLGLTWDRVNFVKNEITLEWQLQRLPKVHGCAGACGFTRPSYCPQAKWKVPAGFDMIPIYKGLAWTRPKSKAGTRSVPILPGFVEMLDVLKAGDSTNPHNLVWHHPDGRPFTPKEDHLNWKTLLTAAQVPDQPEHTIRHSTATLLQSYGVDEPTRMSIMGQNSLAAHRGYIHIDDTQKRLAIATLTPLLMC